MAVGGGTQRARQAISGAQGGGGGLALNPCFLIEGLRGTTRSGDDTALCSSGGRVLNTRPLRLYPRLRSREK